MTAAVELVWDLAGRPDPFGAKADLLKPVPAVCAVTGRQEERTADVNRALGENFTDRSMFRAPHSDRVGPAALWACSGKGTSTLRLWSVVAAPGGSVPSSHEKAFLSAPGLWLGNRADPRPIVRMLADPPSGEWLVSVAVSAQKHVLPYARVNRGGGAWTVRMESTDVTSTPAEWRTVHDTATELRRMGLSPEHIMAGTPGLLRDRADLDRWRQVSAALAAYRGSPVLELALWTITKGTLDG